MPIKELRIDVGNTRSKDDILAAIEADWEAVVVLTEVDRHDMRAEYVEDSFAVEKVERLRGGKVRVTYTYEWGAYYTCQDMCCGAEETETEVAQIDGNQIVFRLDRPEPRSTEDEL